MFCYSIVRGILPLPPNLLCIFCWPCLSIILLGQKWGRNKCTLLLRCPAAHVGEHHLRLYHDWFPQWMLKYPLDSHSIYSSLLIPHTYHWFAFPWSCVSYLAMMKLLLAPPIQPLKFRFNLLEQCLHFLFVFLLKSTLYNYIFSLCPVERVVWHLPQLNLDVFIFISLSTHCFQNRFGLDFLS